MLTVVHNTESANGNVSGGAQSLLIEIVRDGARQMLAATLKAEVAAYIDAHAHEVDDNGHRLVVGNGHHHEREVLTAAAAVSVSAPRVGDKRVSTPIPLSGSGFLGGLALGAAQVPQISEVSPLLYLQ
jgi:putative transposase